MQEKRGVLARQLSPLWLIVAVAVVGSGLWLALEKEEQRAESEVRDREARTVKLNQLAFEDLTLEEYAAFFEEGPIQEAEVQGAVAIAASRNNLALIQAASRTVGFDPGYAANALASAAKVGAIDAVNLLLELRVPPESGYSIETPLRMAAMNGHLEVVESLLAAGALPDGASYNPETGQIRSRPPSPPVTFPARRPSQFDLEMAPFTTGSATPLMAAAALGNDQVVERLLRAGASPGFTSRDGMTILDAAKFSKDPRTIELIEQALAKASR